MVKNLNSSQIIPIHIDPTKQKSEEIPDMEFASAKTKK